MADGKWIRGLSPTMPLPEGARLVLPVRFQSVVEGLPLAAEYASRDCEHVHRLRVASRRATAALRLFEPNIPPKLFRSFKKRLRAVRRSAGDARDWDVFFTLIQGSPIFDFLAGYYAAHRIKAQIALVEIVASESEALRAEIRTLQDDAIDWRESKSHEQLGDLAVSSMNDLMEDMARTARIAADSYEELHHLRILGKRLRYSMEVFIDCFTEPFQERLYPAIEQLQEILGGLTDAHVAVARLTELRDHMKAFHPKEWKRFQQPINSLIRLQRGIFPRECKRFRAWWPRWEKLTKELPPRSLLIQA